MRLYNIARRLWHAEHERLGHSVNALVQVLKYGKRAYNVVREDSSGKWHITFEDKGGVLHEAIFPDEWQARAAAFDENEGIDS